MGAVSIELHTSSALAFLDGASLPEALSDRAAALGYPAIASGRSLNNRAIACGALR